MSSACVRYHTDNEIFIEWTSVDDTLVTYEIQIDADVGSRHWNYIGHDVSLHLSDVSEGQHFIRVRGTDQAGKIVSMHCYAYNAIHANMAVWARSIFTHTSFVPGNVEVNPPRTNFDVRTSASSWPIPVIIQGMWTHVTKRSMIPNK